MFRITPFIFNSRYLLIHRKALDMQLAAISFTPCNNVPTPSVLEREKCPPPPPPPPRPPRDLRLLYGAVAVAVLTGSFAVYAKDNPEVRDWLSIHAPWFDDFIAVAYQENMTYKEFALQSTDDMKEYFKSLFTSEPRKCSDDGKPLILMPVTQKTAEKEDPPKMRSVDEIHCCIKDVGEKLIKNYKYARDTCLRYNQVVEEAMVFFDMKSMKKLESAMSDRTSVVSSTMETIKVDNKKFDELRRYFECGVQGKPEEIERTRTMLDQLCANLKTIKDTFMMEERKSEAMDKLWTMVKDLVSKYSEQAETLLPGLDFSSKKPQLQGDPDILLLHTNQYVKMLENELNETAAGLSRRINRGLASLPQDEMTAKSRDMEIMKTYTVQKVELEKEFVDRYKQLNERNEKALKDALALQLKKQEELLASKMKLRELEVTKKFNKMVDDMVVAEKKRLEKELDEMRQQIKDIEGKLAAKLNAENATRKSQELWAAGAALLAATKKGCPVVKVDKELKAIEKVAKDDKLVNTLLKAIPENVWKEGIVPESTLRRRYHSMEKVALKVALVEQEGAPLPVYLISWLQSIVLFLKLPGIPQNEVEKKPKEPVTDMDTFDILQRARFWVERGDFSTAMHYVRSLQGASLAAAWSWYTAARDHLELRQAADALQAHAAAMALTYV